MGFAPKGKRNGTIEERFYYWQAVVNRSGYKSGEAYQQYINYKRLWLKSKGIQS